MFNCSPDMRSKLESDWERVRIFWVNYAVQMNLYRLLVDGERSTAAVVGGAIIIFD